MKPQESRILIVAQTPAFAEHIRALCPPSPAIEGCVAGYRFDTVDSPAAAVVAIRQARQQRRPYTAAMVDVAGLPGPARLLVQRLLGADRAMFVVGCLGDESLLAELIGEFQSTCRFAAVRDALLSVEVRQLLDGVVQRWWLTGEVMQSRRVIESNRRMLQRLREEAEQARTLRDEFLSNVSHEMRTPLNAILGFSNLLLGETAAPAAAVKARRIWDSANALMRLIENMLDCASLGEGRLLLARAPFALEEALSETIESIRPAAEEKGLAVECQVQHETPRRLAGDGRRFRQILVALLDNAIKFTPRGLIRVQVMVDEDGPDSVSLRVVVTDTGIGIPGDRHGMIFTSFAQVDGSLTRQHGGIGLGLTLARQLADLMGGQIGLRSTPEEGSAFWLSLPFGKSAGACNEAGGWDAARLPSITPPAVACRETPQLESSAPGGRARVLVAQSERLTRTMMEVFLARTGAFVDVAAGAPQTALLIEERRYDLAVLEHAMPDLDAARLQSLLAARSDDPAAPRLRTIVVVPRDDARARALWTGVADRVLDGPASVEEFLEAVHGLCPDLLAPAADVSGPAHQPSGEPCEATTRMYIDALHAALAAADLKAAENHARGLRDVAMEAGWHEIGDDAMRLQLAARSGDDGRLRRVLSKLDGDLQHRFSPADRTPA